MATSPSLRRGYTLLEVTLSMAIVTLIFGGMTSALMLGGNAISMVSTENGAAISGRVLDIEADLRFAISFSERTATSVQFTVPDRSGDGFPETIRYAWSGTAGDPLTRQYNGGTVVSCIDDVASFNLDYIIESIPTDETAPLVESAEVVWLNQEVGTPVLNRRRHSVIRRSSRSRSRLHSRPTQPVGVSLDFNSC